MGLVRFLVPQREYLPAEAAARAYLSALDHVPWKTRVSPTAEGLDAERVESDSGYFHVLWRVAGRPDQVLTTATVCERDEPYNLPVELARGLLNRLRNHLGAWDAVGVAPPRPRRAT